MTSDTPTTRPRVVWIDCLRAAVIVMIVLVHVADYWLTGATNAAVGMYLGSAVIFFMTSGALIFPVTDSRAFLRRRLGRVCPPLVVWLVAYAVLICIAGHGSAATLADTLLWLPLRPSFGAAWFCYALIGLYLFAPVLSPWVSRASRSALDAFLALWLLTGLLPYTGLLRPLADPWASLLGPFIGYAGYMVAGYSLMRFPPSGWTRRRRAAIVAILLAVAFGLGLFMLRFVDRYGLYLVMRNDLTANIMAWSVLVFMAFGAIGTAAVPAVVARVATALSRWSYGIYLSHMAVFSFVVRPLGLGFAASAALTLLIAVGLTAALWRSPLRRFTV